MISRNLDVAICIVLWSNTVRIILKLETATVSRLFILHAAVITTNVKDCKHFQYLLTCRDYRIILQPLHPSAQRRLQPLHQRMQLLLRRLLQHYAPRLLADMTVTDMMRSVITIARLTEELNLRHLNLRHLNLSLSPPFSAQLRNQPSSRVANVSSSRVTVMLVDQYFSLACGF